MPACRAANSPRDFSAVDRASLDLAPYKQDSGANVSWLAMTEKELRQRWGAARRSCSSSSGRCRAFLSGRGWCVSCLLRPVLLLLVPSWDEEGTMRKRLRPIESAPDLCSANKRSLCKATEGAA